MSKKQRTKSTIPDGARVLVRNRRALHDYDIEETMEAGIVLVGSEVKSLRDARGNLQDAYAEIRNDEMWLVNAQIQEYPWANQFNHEPMRPRKLLLHKREIRRAAVKTQQRGFTLIPLAIYLKEGRIKVELALAAGKKLYEKREATREAEAQRDIDRALKQRPR
jgi:SsrA-binding protein